MSSNCLKIRRFRFAERILESIKRDEAEMLQAQEEGRMAQLQGIPSEVIGQIQA